MSPEEVMTEIRERISYFSARQFLDSIWPAMEKLKSEAEQWLKENE